MKTTVNIKSYPNTTVISFTKPMTNFKSFFANGEEVMQNVNMSECTDFYAKGINSETLIYNGRQIIYSCCYTSVYNKFYITSVWSESGCEYEYNINYDELKNKLSRKQLKSH